MLGKERAKGDFEQNKKVGQALPNNKKPFVENNSCVVGPEQKPFRTSTLLNYLIKFDNKGCSLRPLREKVGVVRIRGFSSFDLINPSPALRASSPARGEANRGFTLLELLVVVLIIGILAAIAVPQYQKAVLKSRFSSLMPLAKALNDSEEAYYLEHGTYTEDKTKLDVTSTDTNATVTLGNEELHQYVKLTRSDIKNNLVMYQKHSPNFAGETHCEALIDDTQANWLCKDSLKGTFVGNKFGYSIYSLSEDTVGSLARRYYNQHGLTLDGDTCVSTSSDRYSNTNCGGSIYQNNATCKTSYQPGTGYGECTNSTFENSTCQATSGYGCYSSTFIESICYGNGMYSCAGRSTYSNNSSCIGTSSGSCSGTFTGYSSCVGNSDRWGCCGQPCRNLTLKDHSVCYANAKGACTGSTTYDETSYCAGTYCPVDSPKQDGGTWQLCEGETEGGKTC